MKIISTIVGVTVGWLVLMELTISIPAFGLTIQAAEFYASLRGKDTNPGTLQNPFRTIQKAADMMHAGDTCYVREGTYRETVRPRNSGSEGKPIRFVAYSGEKVTQGRTIAEYNYVHHGGLVQSDGALFQAGSPNIAGTPDTVTGRSGGQFYARRENASFAEWKLNREYWSAV